MRMKCRLALTFIVLSSLSLIACSFTENRRDFYYFCNERYTLSDCEDMGVEMPNNHAFFSQFDNYKTHNYIEIFDKKNSYLELRVEVVDNKPHGFGFINLFSKDGSSILSIEIDDYWCYRIDYQWGSFYYPSFSKDERIYVFGHNCVRFRYPIYIESEGKEVLMTFDYIYSLGYDYPEEFKDLSWMV